MFLLRKTCSINSYFNNLFAWTLKYPQPAFTSKLTMETLEQVVKYVQWCRSGVFMVNFEHISHFVLLLTLNMWLPAGSFRKSLIKMIFFAIDQLLQNVYPPSLEFKTKSNSTKSPPCKYKNVTISSSHLDTTRKQEVKKISKQGL